MVNFLYCVTCSGISGLSDGRLTIADRMKRLLYISMNDPSVPYTGAGARTAAFVQNLADRFDIDLLYLSGSGHPGDAALEQRYAHRLQHPGIHKIIRIPFNHLAYFVYSRQFYKQARDLVRATSYAAIFADYGLASLYAILLSGKFKIPFIYSAHNIEHKQHLGKARGDKRRYFLLPWIYGWERQGCKTASLLVTISEGDASFFKRWTDPAKMITIAQGFDEASFNPFYAAANNNPRIVLFFANFNNAANREAVRVVRDCIADAVLSRYPHTVFRFVGLNPPGEIQHPAFEYIGFAENLDFYVKNADVVISPLLQGWGMPTKIIEALACGKPVISTPIGTRAIPAGFRQLQCCGISEFPQAICEALENGQPVDARDFASIKEMFSWKNLVIRLADRIAQITG
jgi:glycosyltransferase involved in cell wall biosynthesis